ncbi:MAG: acyltransferase [Geobacteraceae bacterium]|nr:acyltransferase [Geobacteraceae bacterium]
MDYSRFGLPDFAGLRKRDYLLALLSGGLLAVAFPKPDLSLLAWVAFVPLLLAAGQKSASKAFRLGFVSGLAAYGALLYWINIVVTTYGKLPLVASIVVFLTLAAYLALYPAVVMYLVRKGGEKGISIIFSFPVVWVGLEFLRSFLLTGFPWASLGYSQYRMVSLIQIADITGVYGISFLVALANAVLYQAMKGVVAKEKKIRPGRGIVLFLVLFSATMVYGYHRLGVPESGTPVKVALVQGNIDQSIKWDPAFQEATVTIYERLTRQASARGADLVVWPESAAPFYFQEDVKDSARIKKLAADIGAYVVVGSPAFDNDGGSIKYRNSAYLVSPQGKIAGRSDKVHLVPFGEYVPLAGLFPFVHKLVVGVGDFSPGEGTFPLSIGKGNIGVLVCFEGIFPELSRGYVQAGSRLLVNITNDAWYGRSSAPYQHLSMTVFRAVENRVPLVRAANTGITAIIDGKGQIRSRTLLFQEAYLEGEVRMGSGDTLYCRYGDVFAKICLALSAIIAIAAFVGKKSKRGVVHV